MSDDITNNCERGRERIWEYLHDKVEERIEKLEKRDASWMLGTAKRIKELEQRLIRGETLVDGIRNRDYMAKKLIKKLEQKINEMKSKLDSYIEEHHGFAEVTIERCENTDKKVDTISAVIKVALEDIKYKLDRLRCAKIDVDPLWYEDDSLERAIKKLKGATDGEPSKKGIIPNGMSALGYIKSLANEEQEAPFPQPPISRYTSILEDVKVGEAEPKHNPFMTMENELKDKLIAEFIDQLNGRVEQFKTFKSRFFNVKLGIILHCLLYDIKGWEGRGKE